MKTRETSSVLFLQNGTAICKYCGRKLEVEHKQDWDEYDCDDYYLYECDCKNWNEEIELDNKLSKLNEEIKEQFREYEKKFDSLLGDDRFLLNKKYNIKTKKLYVIS